jgi:Cellulase (glycosyl hydrolase family 5)
MAAGIRKCLDLGPQIDLPEQHLKTPATAYKVVATGTKWIRTWIDWAFCEKNGRGQYDGGYLALMDEQVSKARDLGINVILTTWKFPLWANGTQGVDPSTFPAEDRGGKALEFRVPENELGVDGAYGRWIRLLISRYKPYGNVVLELMNEPNYQWWPQQDSSGAMSVQCNAAKMMNTAAAINAAYNMLLMAPATSDSRDASNYKLVTPGATFIANLKSALDYINYRGDAHFRWSHHNYADVKNDDYAGYSYLFNALNGWWNGWKTPQGHPGIWLSEGGCNAKALPKNPDGSRKYDLQANLVNNSYFRMAGANGVAMWTNYLLHTDLGYDTGLLNPAPDNTKRPVYDVFHGMAGNV